MNFREISEGSRGVVRELRCGVCDTVQVAEAVQQGAPEGVTTSSAVSFLGPPSPCW